MKTSEARPPASTPCRAWLRVRSPADYPTTMEQWLAMTLFSLGLKQLFVVFAPFAWLIRLFGKKEPAFLLTVVFGIIVVVIREYRSPSPLLAEPFFLGLLVIRGAAQALSVYLYLRGGVLLVWWWELLLQSRLLLTSPCLKQKSLATTHRMTDLTPRFFR